MIDGDEIVDLNVGDQAIPIVLESSAGQIDDPTDLINLYVTARNGVLLPLSSVVSLKEEGVAAELDRVAQRRAIDVDMDVTPGLPLQAAVDELRSIAARVLPDNVSMLLKGEAATLQETSREVALTYAIAFAVVFLVLCAQFEGFTSALVVTLVIPLGIAAAIFALFLTGISINIYSQIGILMLIGIMAKNAILMVEFADQLREKGHAVVDAIRDASIVRLRPIAMTMVSTVLAGLPLILGSGPGAEARGAIGWVVFGGLGMAGLFTLLVTPAFYALIAPLSKPRSQAGQELESELRNARTPAEGCARKYPARNV